MLSEVGEFCVTTTIVWGGRTRTTTALLVGGRRRVVVRVVLLPRSTRSTTTTPKIVLLFYYFDFQENLRNLINRDHVLSIRKSYLAYPMICILIIEFFLCLFLFSIVPVSSLLCHIGAVAFVPTQNVKKKQPKKTHALLILLLELFEKNWEKV
jgi:hypothetical protein